MHTIKLEKHQFEGPLDLLLSLIEEQKLDITQVALAQVTEQFLQHIRQLETIDPTALSDYLFIAAKLLVIKSKAILPTLEVEEEEEEVGQDLEMRLALYKQYKEVTKALKEMDANGLQSFTRTLVFSERVSFFPDPDISTQTLHDSILHIVNDLKELDNLPKAKIKEAISIQEKIDHLQTLLSRQIETKLSSLIAGAKNKSEVVITFLALLELIKQRILIVDQEALFTDITIKQYKASVADIPEENNDIINPEVNS